MLIKLNFSSIPMVLWGEKSEHIYIYVHGMHGKKEDAEKFSETANKKGFQVLSFDLPGHGERRNNENNNAIQDPYKVLSDIETVYNFADSEWKKISLYAVSIGAWFSMISVDDTRLENALFVSPVVNMKNLIERMMKNSGVTPEILKNKKIIPEANLSWDYYKFVLENEITEWNCKTKILYPENDEIIPYCDIKEFVEKFKCDLTVLPKSEHWIHSEEHVKFLRDWEAISID